MYFVVSVDCFVCVCLWFCVVTLVLFLSYDLKFGDKVNFHYVILITDLRINLPCTEMSGYRALFRDNTGVTRPPRTTLTVMRF